MDSLPFEVKNIIKEFIFGIPFKEEFIYNDNKIIRRGYKNSDGINIYLVHKYFKDGKLKVFYTCKNTRLDFFSNCFWNGIPYEILTSEYSEYKEYYPNEKLKQCSIFENGKLEKLNTINEHGCQRVYYYEKGQQLFGIKAFIKSFKYNITYY